MFDKWLNMNKIDCEGLQSDNKITGKR